MNKNKRKHPRHQGITLIALVVTIIVMLILTAVIVSMTFGDDGVITEAKYAEKIGTKAELESKLRLIHTSSKLKATREKVPYTYDYFVEKVKEKMGNEYSYEPKGDSENIFYTGKNDTKILLKDIFEEKKIDLNMSEEESSPENIPTQDE